MCVSRGIGVITDDANFWVIRISHWRHTMVDGAKFWISCKQPAFLSSFSRLQVIQNSAPSTILWRQCDIRIEVLLSWDLVETFSNPAFVNISPLLLSCWKQARLVKAEALFNICQFEHAMVHFHRGMVRSKGWYRKYETDSTEFS